MTLSVLKRRFPRPHLSTAASSPESTTMRPRRVPMRRRIQRMRSSSATAPLYPKRPAVRDEVARLGRSPAGSRLAAERRAAAQVLEAFLVVRGPAAFAADERLRQHRRTDRAKPRQTLDHLAALDSGVAHPHQVSHELGGHPFHPQDDRQVRQAFPDPDLEPPGLEVKREARTAAEAADGFDHLAHPLGTEDARDQPDRLRLYPVVRVEKTVSHLAGPFP